ncbi:hypothetical protein SKAU_G00104480 [Synaphobranchus kaupii]|uniref:Uncharacterized protein n=1 Tax=Synaphobranchus kaupii TaxID=118154 RepID=A0A9Q1G030_SYNKA|nr:hypothetical protein SKAU_G00104480 [Synaphobranchus kaupii]
MIKPCKTAQQKAEGYNIHGLCIQACKQSPVSILGRKGGRAGVRFPVPAPFLTGSSPGIASVPSARRRGLTARPLSSGPPIIPPVASPARACAQLADRAGHATSLALHKGIAGIDSPVFGREAFIHEGPGRLKQSTSFLSGEERLNIANKAQRKSGEKLTVHPLFFLMTQEWALHGLAGTSCQTV